MELRLEVVEGPDEGLELVYDGAGPFVIGRGGQADRNLRRLTDPAVSRMHLVLRPEPACIQGSAVKACNPIHTANGPRVAARLASGDVFRIGQTSLRIAYGPRTPASGADGAGAVSGPERRQFEDFVLGDEIGRGALGRVHEAVDCATGERVALKILRPDLDAIASAGIEKEVLRERAAAYFLRELDIVARLDHPNLVRTLAVGREQEELFLVMELIDGATLSEHVRATGTLAIPEVAGIAEGLLGALAHAHDQGIVHRDVCPSNVMLEASDEGLRARVLDFGMAKDFLAHRHLSLTRTGEGRGQIHYLAPECLSDAKHAGPAADVFGAGATLYFALTGTRWHRGGEERAATFDAIRAGDLVPLAERNPQLPPALCGAIEGALRRRPEDRWPSAVEMARALAFAAKEAP